MEIKTLLDRRVQRSILVTLAERYPFEVDINAASEAWHKDQSIVFANLCYLREHNLIEFDARWDEEDQDFHVLRLGASHRGLDFLMDDGGLSAILNIVTVKLHDETIQALLSAKVDASNLPAEQKQSLLNQIRELRGEAAKHLVTKIIDYGLDQGPTAMHWLTAALKSLQA